MKKVILSIGVVLGFVFLVACGSGKTSDSADNESQNTEVQVAEASFKVFGNCGMCKDRIEKAAKEVNGVKTVEWNKDTKMLKLTHDNDLDINDVHNAVASVGHDTEVVRAEDAVYEGLHSCCKYERTGN